MSNRHREVHASRFVLRSIRFITAFLVGLRQISLLFKHPKVELCIMNDALCIKKVTPDWNKCPAGSFPFHK